MRRFPDVLRGWVHGLRLLVRRASPNKRRVSALAIGLALLGSVSYIAYIEHEKRSLRRAIAELARDTGSRFHDALRTVADEGGSAQQRLDDHYFTIDRHLKRLRSMDTAPAQDLARAADDYMLTVREIAKRLASGHRYRAEVLETVRALQVHMGEDKRTGAWVTQAVQRRERLRTEYRAYRLTSEALVGLLNDYASSRARLAQHIDSAFMPEDSMALAVRDLILKARQKIAEDVERAGALETYR
ncbi:MAG TPA: hypothetical protein VFY80_08535 [Burkholderiales bacterium]|nr:hypothetical protein [Burkholderiales bacterium]